MATTKTKGDGVLNAQLLEKCTRNFFEIFIYDYGNNLAEYIGQILTFEGSYCVVGLRMLNTLYFTALDKNVLTKLASLTSIINRLPFCPHSNAKEQLFYSKLLLENENTSIKDIDLSVQGKVLNFPERSIPNGSVRFC